MVEHVPAQMTGIFVFGAGQTPLPAGDGILCLGGSPLFRLGAVAADAAGRPVELGRAVQNGLPTRS